MKSSVTKSAGPIHLGMDTSKDKIVVGILRWGEQIPDVETIINYEASVRRLIDPADLLRGGSDRVRLAPVADLDGKWPAR
ncbi:MAG TPA: hypothetical protein DGG94_01000 [Micromonosporaceae bacterium]|nr:hypothetical protein [Micromonosporaceae bacterium]HCU48409.1 hypothetical protein [Micromonosporaceae bacterium]